MNSFRLRPEAGIALAYLAFGALWILFSDQFVASLALSTTTIMQLQTYKGWLFVSASALLIFGLLRHAFSQERLAQERLLSKQAQLAGEIAERLHAEELLRRVSLRLAEAQESERLALSKELHDQVGQSLTALGINLNLIQAEIGPSISPSLRAHFSSASELLQEITDKIRDIMGELHPPVLQNYGLAAALRWLAERIQRQTGLQVEVQGEIIEPRLPMVTAISLFRIAREALNNVIKHAQASRAWVRVEATPEQVILCIQDDGQGFDPAITQNNQNSQWGLATMRERVELLHGSMKIESAPGEGTTIIVRVPRAL
ncbi:MAG: sensor histidine kinase [Anaerolineales bacterium]|nr:sensor histidine kinase [Anaerolineales bacterium]